MDWNQTDSENGPRVQLAVAKLPAKIPVTDHRYGGMVWLQSGGPGESGIQFLLDFGTRVQNVVDGDGDPTDPQGTDDQHKFFDIVGIDSRGLNNSTPCFSCFPSPTSKRLWSLEQSAEGILGSHDGAFETWWARMEALGEGCSAKARRGDNEGDMLASHVSTTPQIADIVAILEAHGRWREKEAKRLLSFNPGKYIDTETADARMRTKWEKDGETLYFWGFSYGTVIGAMFAAMQPHRVERVVLDGVVDTLDYMQGTRLHALQDTDGVLDNLAEYCDIAGPKDCALYKPGGPIKIVESIRTILATLKEQPIGVPGSEDGTLAPELITYSDVIRPLFSSLYSPILSFPRWSSRFFNLSQGDGSAFAAAKRNRNTLWASPALFPNLPSQINDDQCLTQRYTPGDTRLAIICTDGNSTLGISHGDFVSYVETVRQQSPFFGDMFAQVRMMCIRFGLKAKWRFEGPYIAKTSYPLLLVGTKKDPVTPIRKYTSPSTAPVVLGNSNLRVLADI